MIVADASWVIALRDPHNAHHARAVALSDLHLTEVVTLHPITFAECLVAPAHLGRLHESAADLRAAFHITHVDDDAPLRWAELRAETNLRLPDAIVLDTALQLGAPNILTFDDRLIDAARSHGISTA